MEHREEVEKSWTAFQREHGDGIAISAAQLLKWDKPRPKHGDTWGNWQYDAKVMVLTYLPEDYEIDLEQCTTSAKTMDRIFQLCNKTWLSAKDGGDMLQALNDLLDPQANLCSFGQDKKFDATKHLKNLGR
jgi:hypothetical protein